jgi:hypothetical protein
MIMIEIQILNEDLISRMAAEGVIANVQPSFVPTDMILARSRLSLEQQRFSYAWKSMLDAGVIVAGGSDSPIEFPSPFVGIYDAMYRTNAHKGQAVPDEKIEISMDVYWPDECLTFAEALWMYTIGASFASFSESRSGCISSGFWGDFVLVDPSILSNPSILRSVRPSIVIVGGTITYSSDQRQCAVKQCADSATSPISKDKNFDAMASLMTETKGPFNPGKGGNLSCNVSEAGRSDGKKLYGSPAFNSQQDILTLSSWPLSKRSSHSAYSCACLLKGLYCVENIDEYEH